MKSNFKTVTRWLLISEGGFVDHNEDPGGATNKGVTQRVYDAYRRRNNLPEQSVRFITDQEVLEIYRTQYWDTIQGNLLPSGLDYALYDFSVNSGPSRAVSFLQRILKVKVDGVMGNVTLAAIRNADDVSGLIVDLCNNRWNWLKTLKTYGTFGRGWTRRVMGEIPGAQPSEDVGVIDRSLMLCMGDNDIPEPKEAFPGKADPKDKKLSEKIKDELTVENAAKVGAGSIPALSMIPSGPLQWAVAVAVIILVITGAFFILKKEEII